ncbi:AbrB/MazE/SpoVT family DNA-binding domain-containing protein [Candidatus Pacearchaeota archaeon]|nr:AbrB/MazE/SpoVT family DNA-binding domain-containing protein [Candidatus Pacearchaeota archaeon]
MTQIEALTRRWGDSIAVIIPKKIVELARIKPKDKVKITIEKTTDLSDLFGKLKTSKTPQKMKDESRKGWS